MTLSASSAAAAGRASGAVGGSFFCVQPPATVYQTFLLPSGRQDGSTLQEMAIHLSKPALASLSTGQPLPDLVYGALRRCDGRELETFDEATGKMQGLRLSQPIFVFELQGASLLVKLHRKELPVSTNFGGAPFVLAVLLKPVGELVTSSAFVVASKETAPKPPRGPLKRERAPSNKLPVVAPAVGEEAVVNAMLKSLKRQRKAAAAESDNTSSATVTTSPAAPVLPKCSVGSPEAFPDLDDAFFAAFDDASPAAVLDGVGDDELGCLGFEVDEDGFPLLSEDVFLM